jgi:hypothetical protein
VPPEPRPCPLTSPWALGLLPQAYSIVNGI